MADDYDAYSKQLSEMGEPANINYQVKLSTGSSHNNRLTIKARIPEQITLSVQSHWEAALGSAVEGIQGLPGISTGFGIARTAGYLGAQMFMAQTIQSWSGTDPLSFTIPMIFDAHTDAYQDVWLPVHKLAQMCSPGLIDGNWRLVPPGPNGIREAFGGEGGRTEGSNWDQLGGENIQLEIGRHLKLPSVILISADPVFDSKFTEEGYPISAEVNLTIQTPFVPTKQFLEDIFNIAPEDRLAYKE